MTGRLSPASLATLLMLVAAGTSALQNLVIRLAGDSGVHSFQIAFLRSFFGFVVILVLPQRWQIKPYPIGFASLCAVNRPYNGPYGAEIRGAKVYRRRSSS